VHLLFVGDLLAYKLGLISEIIVNNLYELLYNSSVVEITKYKCIIHYGKV